jgi:acetoacetate decarboxylase
MPLTRYVKSEEEVRRLQEILAAPAFSDIRSLAVTFESEPAVVAELLPPPLEPPETPLVTISVSQIRRSNCVGPFDGAVVDIACRYGGAEGVYCLTMPMSTDFAVMFGRELYAEPKKLATISLDTRDGFARGRVTRYGITYIEITGRFEEPMARVERPTESAHYYFKYMPNADGCGLAFDPQLVRVAQRGRLHRATRGTGTITFRESTHDPIVDVPVLSVLGATLSEGEVFTTAEVVATVPAEKFLPYAFGKSDDMTVWALAETGSQRRQ